MTDKKFTDEEIKKALECCIKGETWGECEEMGCPAFNRQGCYFYLRTDDDYEGVIYVEIIKEALDLINRQQAEIERLERHTEMYHELRAEAIKEFAERLNAQFSDMENQLPSDRKIIRINEVKSLMDWILHDITREVIEEVAKEMTEDHK